MDKIIIKGAREHNLKNIDIELPRDSLIVISGLSGSGKSSLAFDTIFAEGQRRYVESLSSYARMFLGRLDKPDLDYIEGLSPAISIEQKSTHRNPRSTVGTVTEIYDYLRLLFARIGKPHCPKCGKEIKEQSVDQIIDTILTYPEETKVMLLSPVIKNRKGEHSKILEDAKKAGFARLRIDGINLNLQDELKLEKNKKHTIEIIVDRIKISNNIRKRLAESVETALDISDGQIIVLRKSENKDIEEFYSVKNSCADCGISMPELQPRLFSFNNPEGACPDCSGLGMTMEFDPDLIIPDKNLSFNEGAVKTHNPEANWHRSWFEALSKEYKFSLNTPFNKLPEEILNKILYGTDDELKVKYFSKNNNANHEYKKNFEGILKELKRRYIESSSNYIKEWLETFMCQNKCSTCDGKRLRPESLSVKIGKKNIYDVTCLSVKDAFDFLSKLELSETEQKISSQIMKEILARLSFMMNVGLEYLDLERKAATLSGGEAQRIRLATQIGSSLVGVLYILDEPSIGLHQRDNQRLIDTLLHLRNIGNTLIVVEHDEQTIRTADYIVDLGPGAGVNGGNVIAKGNYEEILKNENSLTGQFLSGKLRIDVPEIRRKGNGKYIEIKRAEEHNLKKIDVSFPLGKFIVVTGVSGSGKSTLMEDILYPAIHNKINRTNKKTGKIESVTGIENIDKIINIDQSPIGRTPRSNPATYVGLFTPIRELFANLPEAKARGYKPGRFSFNVKGGRCEECKGDGTKKIEMHFLSDVYVTCDVCHGKRFNKETIDVRYKGKNIFDVLEMTVEEGIDFFEKIPKVYQKLKTLCDVGLEYIKLGQSALTLSGGEAQRIKLALELSKRNTGKTFYIIDEPTTGLHFADVKKLLEVLQLLVDKGNTVALIEHNLDVIKQADHIIDLGPEGGDKGGEVIAEGTPEEVSQVKKSYTGHYLLEVL